MRGTGIVGILVALLAGRTLVAAPKPWRAGKAAAWYREQPWLVGSNFIPANAINELEMWQASTFDAQRIDVELGWAFRDIFFSDGRSYRQEEVDFIRRITAKP